eukprot:SAG31_NODE_3454_length_4253_cov_2.613866_4_plen_66_part_00
MMVLGAAHRAFATPLTMTCGFDQPGIGILSEICGTQFRAQRSVQVWTPGKRRYMERYKQYLDLLR